MGNIDYRNIKITDGFWKVKQNMISDVTLQSVYNRFKETHRFDALDCTWKEGEPDMPHVFWDSDIAKWLEGLAYSLTYKDNDELVKIADESIEKRVSVLPSVTSTSFIVQVTLRRRRLRIITLQAKGRYLMLCASIWTI